MIKFEWNEIKNKINQKKHGITFEEASHVFEDECALLFDDPKHSEKEDRFLIIGMDNNARVCIVSHCYREKHNDEIIRIISARKATPKERKAYENQ